MTLRWLLAALHLLALGIGLGSIFARGYAARHLDLEKGIRGLLLADSFWGLSALIWISTGLLRAFGGFEKGSVYYLDSTLFWVKMSLLLLVLVLEIWPMMRLIQWRMQQRSGTAMDTGAASRIAVISYTQTVLIILMVLAATAMARGMDL
jgi:putative membrane protein